MTGWVINWLNDCLMEWLMDGSIVDWLIDWLIVWLMIDWLTDWLIDWLYYRLNDWLSEWLADWLCWSIVRLFDWLIDWLIDWLSSQGSKGGAVVRALASHQCGPGSNPGVDAICGLSLLLVLSLVSRGFSPGTPVFPSPQKPTFPNSNLIGNHVDVLPANSYLFVYLFYLAGWLLIS